jgi:hypothetical protein
MKLVALVCLTGLSVISVSSAYSQEMSPIEWGIDRPGNDILLVSLPGSTQTYAGTSARSTTSASLGPMYSPSAVAGTNAF